MKKILLLVLALSGVAVISVASLAAWWPTVLPTRADEVDDLQKQIDELAHLRQLSEAATAPLEGQVDDLERRINSAQAGINQAKKDANALAENIAQREKELGHYYGLLKDRIFSEYKQLRRQNWLDVLLQSQLATAVVQQLAYHSALREENSDLIAEVEEKIIQLEADKKSLEEKQTRLAALQTQLDSQADFFRGEIAKAKQYQTELSGKIAELSARQQEIINARSGSFTVSGDSELSDDPLAGISAFRSQAPGGYFAVFSFGAYSHRNGMSQYGALGRAKEGQNYEKILKAYYPGTEIKKDYDAMDNISVNGHGSMSFEDRYLMGIYEVPGSWPMEVLKAQAIAARTYAIRYTNNGQKSICTTEACQVFKNSPKGGNWEKAVKETKGMVLVDGGGNPVSTQFASTHGGWAKGVGWDTKDGKGGGNFMDKAYDAIGGSPWFYKAWWRAGYSSGGATCGRSNPWLSPKEMADIVNAHVVLKRGSNSEAERVTPITTDCWGGNPYSQDELRDVAGKYGGISSATSVAVALGNGRTNTVTINGVSMSGDEFCKAFNLRASGNLRIPQWSGAGCSGAFFNIEKK